MDEYSGNVTKSTLNIVTDPFQYAMSSNMNGLNYGSWLFHFKFKTNSSDQIVLSTINEYFTRFRNINLRSQIYAWVTMEGEKRLFEVYRKMIGMNLIISELCRVEENNAEIKNGNQIWTRRKNLTGVNLKVAYQPTSFLHEKNNVSTFRYLLNTFSLILICD
jgi:hypothetical protein